MSQLQPMTESITHQLGLTPLLRIRPRALGNFPREAGLLLPYERVFRLQLAQDPTADDVVPGGTATGNRCCRRRSRLPRMNSLLLRHQDGPKNRYPRALHQTLGIQVNP